MSKAMLLTWTTPAPDVTEADFDTWYEQVHVPQVREAVPSVTVVHRYRTAELQGPMAAGQPPHRFLAVYELDSSDVDSALAALGGAVAEGRFTRMEILDTAHAPSMQWYTAI